MKYPLVYIIFLIILLAVVEILQLDKRDVSYKFNNITDIIPNILREITKF